MFQLEEGQSYTARVQVKNTSTKQGTPVPVTLSVALTSDLALSIPSPEVQQGFAALETLALDFPFSVPVNLGGKSGKMTAAVISPTREILAYAQEGLAIGLALSDVTGFVPTAWQVTLTNLPLLPADVFSAMMLPVFNLDAGYGLQQAFIPYGSAVPLMFSAPWRNGSLSLMVVMAYPTYSTPATLYGRSQHFTPLAGESYTWDVASGIVYDSQGRYASLVDTTVSIKLVNPPAANISPWNRVWCWYMVTSTTGSGAPPNWTGKLIPGTLTVPLTDEVLCQWKMGGWHPADYSSYLKVVLYDGYYIEPYYSPNYFLTIPFHFVPEPDVAHPARCYIVDLTTGRVLL